MPRTSLANWSESRLGAPLAASVSGVTLTQARLLRSVERGEVGGQCRRLLGWQARVRGHDPRPDLQRSRYRVSRQAAADLGQLRPGAVVAVVPKLVAGKAARLGHHLLA